MSLHVIDAKRFVEDILWDLWENKMIFLKYFQCKKFVLKYYKLFFNMSTIIYNNVIDEAFPKVLRYS